MIARDCVRGLVEDEQRRILLVLIVEASTQRGFWITPGGGRETGESDHEALARELYEETGLREVPTGPHIWTRDFTFDWEGTTYRQFEKFYWLRVAHFEPRPEALQGEIEHRSFAELRWWTLDEIADSTEVFAPLDLADRIRSLREHGAPAEPIEIGA